LRIVIDGSVTVIVEIVTEFDLPQSPSEVRIVAIGAANCLVPVHVAAGCIDFAISVEITISESKHIAVFIDRVFVTHLDVTRIPIAAIVVAIITKDVPVFVLTAGIKMPVAVEIRRFKVATVLLFGASIQGASNVVVAVERRTLSTTVVIRVLVVWIARLLAVADLVVRTVVVRSAEGRRRAAAEPLVVGRGSSFSTTLHQK
jgi:hypothetical protein